VIRSSNVVGLIFSFIMVVAHATEEIPPDTSAKGPEASAAEVYARSPETTSFEPESASDNENTTEVIVAPNLDLKQVVPEQGLSQPSLQPIEVDDDLKSQALAASKGRKQTNFSILGAEVAPGTSTRLPWSPQVGIAGLSSPTPVLIVNGAFPGETLCLTAAIHGDELNGIEIVRRVLYDLKPEKLHGVIIGVPIVNLQGFQRGSRYLPDRRDLNRYFPGAPDGSLASRIAFSFFNEVIFHCDALIDFHTGSFRRTNLPQLRADMRHPDVMKFTESFDATVVLHSRGHKGMLRTAAVEHGIPAITLEVGESLRLQEKQVEIGVKIIKKLLDREQMYHNPFNWGKPEPVYYKSRWLRATSGGILFSHVKLGEQVNKGDVLGTVTDPITNVQAEIVASVRGRVLGMAINQVVMPGFAAFHIGIEAPEKTLIDANGIDEPPGTEETLPEEGPEEFQDLGTVLED
jgi:uncharacterized protein